MFLFFKMDKVELKTELLNMTNILCNLKMECLERIFGRVILALLLFHNMLDEKHLSSLRNQNKLP